MFLEESPPCAPSICSRDGGTRRSFVKMEPHWVEGELDEMLAWSSPPPWLVVGSRRSFVHYLYSSEGLLCICIYNW